MKKILTIVLGASAIVSVAILAGGQQDAERTHREKVLRSWDKKVPPH
jgi:hypothetical protein